MDLDWGALWDDGSEDDEDYDPLKDTSIKKSTDDDDSDSDFEGLSALLSTQRGKRKKKTVPAVEDTLASPDVICKRTRKNFRIDEDALAQAEEMLDE